jgi:hypothetical protein
MDIRPEAKRQQDMRRSLSLLMRLSLYLAVDGEEAAGDEDSLFLGDCPIKVSIYLATDGKKTGSEEAAG